MDFSRLLPLHHKLLVMRLLAACLRILDLVVLPLEPPILLFAVHCFLDKVLRSVLLIDAGRVEFGRAFDDGADLRELRDLGFLGAGLLVVPVWVEDGAHLQHLQVALEGWGYVCEGHVEPVCAGVGWAVLLSQVSWCH